MIEIEIWSDVLCPFCYIGKRRFETALQTFEHKEEVKIVWKSFQLDPDFQAEEQKNYAGYLQKRKGWSNEQTAQMLTHVTQIANQAGLDFHFEKALVANSFEAHRLLHFAKEQSLQNALKETLLEAHFVKGLDIGDVKTLSEIGRNIGLSSDSIHSFLNTSKYKEEIEKDIYEAVQIGVRGVPFFVFNRKYALSGAQESNVFLQALNQAFTEIQASESNFCDIDGNC